MLSYRSQDRKAKPHKGWREVQRSRDPKKTEAPIGAGGLQQQFHREAFIEWNRCHTGKRCININQNMHLEKRGEGTQISPDPQKTFPEKPGRYSTKAHNIGDGPREAGFLTKQKLSQRRQDRKAKAQKGLWGTQRNREPNRTKCCPRGARTEKQIHTTGGREPEKPGP